MPKLKPRRVVLQERRYACWSKIRCNGTIFSDYFIKDRVEVGVRVEIDLSLFSIADPSLVGKQ